MLGSEAAYVVHGLDRQESDLRAGALPTDEGYGVEDPSAWGTLGIDGSDVPLEPVPSERGDYSEFYAGVAACIGEGAPAPVDPRDSLEALRIIAQVHERAVHS